MSNFIMPSGQGNFYDPDQVIYNDTNYVESSGAIFKGSESNLPRTPTATLPSPEQQVAEEEITSFTESSGVINPQAAIVDGDLATANGSPFSNASKFQPTNFTQGDYIHYIPDPNGGLGMIDKVPYAINFDPSVVIQTNSTPYYRYG